MLVDAEVLANQVCGDPAQGVYRIVLKSPLAGEALPGQFIKIQVTKSYEPLLRRPISIAQIDKNSSELTLYYRIKGKGTDILSKVKPEESLSVLGPLGTGFTIPKSGELCLVAGGIGIFPLMGVAQAALAKGLNVRLFWGGENAVSLEAAGLSFWQALGIPLHLATMDGSIGKAGLVTESFQDFLENFNLKILNQENEERLPDLQVATCGPRGMMKLVAEHAYNFHEDIKVEVSLEERMACGLGACLGCTCNIKTGEGEQKRGKVCKDGPVFEGKEVLWDVTN